MISQKSLYFAAFKKYIFLDLGLMWTLRKSRYLLKNISYILHMVAFWLIRYLHEDNKYWKRKQEASRCCGDSPVATSQLLRHFFKDSKTKLPPALPQNQYLTNWMLQMFSQPLSISGSGLNKFDVEIWPMRNSTCSTESYLYLVVVSISE